VLATLRKEFGASEDAVTAWIARWIADGFTAVESLIGDDRYCFGPQPGMADLYLIPRVFSARRFGVLLDAFPRIRRVDALAQAHPAFVSAAPENQPDGV
jgi:glutathione S-transferase